MRYLDTSILLAVLLPETGSDAAEMLMSSEGETLAVSSWTEVELLSALGVKLRTKQVTKREAQSAVDAYTYLVSPSLRILKINDADHQSAAALMKGWQTALRASDSLHLAIASAHGATVFTFDQAMAKAAATLGISVRLLGEI